jgi:hypothetical protein
MHIFQLSMSSAWVPLDVLSEIVIHQWGDNSPLIKEVKERRKNKRHHAHIAEDDELVFKTCYRTVCRKGQKLELGLETGVTGASPPTVTSMGSSFYLGGQVQGRRP